MVSAKPRPVFPVREFANTGFAADVRAGLLTRPKRIAPKYFYDREGSRLFEEITRQPEYYPTRCEVEILREHAADMAQLIPPGAVLIEFGSGSATKADILLRAAAKKLAAYIPVDISADFLAQEAENVRKRFPGLEVAPLVADFLAPFTLPPIAQGRPKAGFFPGSTIGNLEPYDAAAFLRMAAGLLGDGAVLIVGVDLVKDTDILNAAYNDAAGITAAFNLNLLTRMNRELGAAFNRGHFEHHAFYNPARQRVEMHLASRLRQKIWVAGEMIDFRSGETIHTENSYKYTLSSFAALARGAGWSTMKVWTDSRALFSVHALVRR